MSRTQPGSLPFGVVPDAGGTDDAPRYDVQVDPSKTTIFGRLVAADESHLTRTRESLGRKCHTPSVVLAPVRED
jgi:hypothetical protein